MASMMFQFEIEQLTEFNHALIYCFSPESSSKRLRGSTDIRDVVFPEVAQYGDMFRAYLYAQNEILPFIREHSLAAVTPEKLIEWITNGHREIANGLLKAEGVSSGIYSRQQVLRTHAGWQLSSMMLSYLAQRPMAAVDQVYIDNCIRYVQTEFNIDSKHLNDLIHLLLKASKFSNDILFPSQLLTAQSGDCYTAISKLSAAYIKNVFSAEEKQVIDRVMKICLPPELIEEHMSDFSSKIVKKWQSCQTENLDEVLDLISEAFFGITEIHSFPNGNGRIATWLVNIMLKSLQWPDILLRYPGEKNKEDTTYSIAISQIDKTLEPLKQHLKQRIIEAKTVPYENLILKRYVEARIELAELCQQIFSQHPKYDLNNNFLDLALKISQSLPPVYSYEDYAALTPHLELASIGLKKIKTRLDAEKAATISFFKPTHSTTDCKVICETLEALTGVSPWKGYRQGTTFLFESKDSHEIKRVVEQLRACPAHMRIAEFRNKSTKNPVIQCTEIDKQQLLAIASKPGTSTCPEISSGKAASSV